MKWQGDDRPPAGWKRLVELKWTLSRLWRGWGHLGPRGPADGPPALVIPGFLANDRTIMPVRQALARAGWRVHGWGYGLNLRVTADTLERLEACLDGIGAKQPVLLVGWSLGGLFARELAHLQPKKVRAVVTLCSPFSGDLKTNTNIREFYEWIAGHDVDHPPFERRSHLKPPVPSLAFWSRRDGIVAPRAARGSADEVDRAIEIDTNHMGVVLWRPALTRIVSEIEGFLAAVEGRLPVVRPSGTSGAAESHA